MVPLRQSDAIVSAVARNGLRDSLNIVLRIAFGIRTAGAVLCTLALFSSRDMRFDVLAMVQRPPDT